VLTGVVGDVGPVFAERDERHGAIRRQKTGRRRQMLPSRRSSSVVSLEE
jgi:hypothetical protein